MLTSECWHVGSWQHGRGHYGLRERACRSEGIMTDSSDGGPYDRLKHLLNDERARRAWAERELARERERSAHWKRKAEQRQAMLVRLQAAGWLRRLRRFIGQHRTAHRTTTEVAEVVALSEPQPSIQPMFPAVFAVADFFAAGLLKSIVNTVVVDDASETDILGADFVATTDGDVGPVDPLIQGWLDVDERRPLLRVCREGDVRERPEHAVDLSAQDTEHLRRSLQMGHATAQAPRGDFSRYETHGGGLLVATDRDGQTLWTLIGSGQPEGAAIDLALEGVPLIRWSGGGEPPVLDLDTRLRASVATQRWLWARYSPIDAGRSLLGSVGVDTPDISPQVTAVLVSNRPERLDEAVARIQRSKGIRFRVVIGLHGHGDAAAVGERLGESGVDATVLTFDGGWSLGRCLNAALSQVGTELWAKIDDDDHYGPSYLLDGAISARLTRADLLGKPTYFAFLEQSDETILVRQGIEQGSASYFPGASFIGRRRLWEDIPFSHRHSRVDSTFLTAAARAGASMWATTRFEFQVNRTKTHTWHADPAFFLARGERCWVGNESGRVDIGPSELSACGLSHVNSVEEDGRSQER